MPSRKIVIFTIAIAIATYVFLHFYPQRVGMGRALEAVFIDTILLLLCLPSDKMSGMSFNVDNS